MFGVGQAVGAVGEVCVGVLGVGLSWGDAARTSSPG